MAVRQPQPAEPSHVDVANAVVEAMAGVPGVVELDGGTFGEFATFGPGQRVPGVRVRADDADGGDVALQIVARYGQVLRELAEEVRARVLGELTASLPTYPVRAVDVHIVDVATGPRQRQLPAQSGVDTPSVGPGGTRPASATGLSAEGPPAGGPEQLGAPPSEQPPPRPPGQPPDVDRPTPPVGSDLPPSEPPPPGARR